MSLYEPNYPPHGKSEIISGGDTKKNIINRERKERGMPDSNSKGSEHGKDDDITIKAQVKRSLMNQVERRDRESEQESASMNLNLNNQWNLIKI